MSVDLEQVLRAINDLIDIATHGPGTVTVSQLKELKRTVRAMNNDWERNLEDVP